MSCGFPESRQNLTHDGLHTHPESIQNSHILPDRNGPHPLRLAAAPPTGETPSSQAGSHPNPPLPYRNVALHPPRQGGRALPSLTGGYPHPPSPTGAHPPRQWANLARPSLQEGRAPSSPTGGHPSSPTPTGGWAPSSPTGGHPSPPSPTGGHPSPPSPTGGSGAILPDRRPS